MTFDGFAAAGTCPNCGAQPLQVARTLSTPGSCGHGLLLDSNIESCVCCGSETPDSKQRRARVQRHLEMFHAPHPHRRAPAEPTGAWSAGRR